MNLVPIEHGGQRVLTTQQLAEFYGEPPVKLQQNFSNNRQRYAEGEHYFRIEHGQGGKLMSKIDQIKLQTLVELGVRDAECARVVGCTREYVRQWKIKNGYLEPVNYVEERFLEFYRQGMYDAEIAANCGVSSTSVSYWRRKNGLPPHRKNAKKYEEFLNLYKQGLNDSEIARKVGTYPAAVYRWRTKNNLPANAKPVGRKRA